MPRGIAQRLDERELTFYDDFSAEKPLESACRRALDFLVGERLGERRAADGRIVGIQATLATNASGDGALDLYQIIDGLVGDPARAEDVFAADPLRDMWQRIADEVQAKLGFPLEPELFSNMVVVALLGGAAEPQLKPLLTSLLGTFRHSDMRGLYHFFTSLRFAGDTDCTGMAARARLAMGELDPATERGAQDLARICDRLLGSAAVDHLSAEENATYGKDNGALQRHVFKVYLDDHELQGAALDRGLKNNPVVAVNALFPLLVELTLGLRDPHARVVLKEFPGPGAPAREGSATVVEIVARNLAYVVGHLFSGAWRDGCRYYGSPDSYLCFFSDLVREFPEIDELFGVNVWLRAAIVERRSATTTGIADPKMALNLALRAIAADNLELDASVERDGLLALQARDGGFHDFSPLYAFGTSHGPRVHFGSVAQTTALALRALSGERPRSLPRGRGAVFGEIERAVLAAAAG